MIPPGNLFLISTANQLINNEGYLVQKGLGSRVDPLKPKEKVRLLKKIEKIKQEKLTIETIGLPIRKDLPSHTMILNTLRLQEKTPLTLALVRRAVIVALLSHPRQGNHGSCFAAPLVIALVEHNQKQCLADLKCLIEKSRLTRTIHGVKKDFPSFTDVSLLSAYEKSIAAMAEAEEGGMIQTVILSSLQRVLKKEGKKKEIKKSDLNPLLKAFQTTLINRMYLFYDPNIDQFSLSQDTHSEQGAFVFYDKGNHTSPKNWKRIDTPDGFREMILDIFSTMNETGSELLISYINTKSFLYDLIVQYCVKNQGVDNPVENYRTLSYTPWITKTGNNFSRVLKVFYEKDAIKTVHYTPYDISEMLTRLQSIQNPPPMLPARVTGLHAFNLLLHHPTFHKMNLIEMKNCAERIGERCVTDKIKQLLFNFIEAEILEPKTIKSFKRFTDLIDERINLIELKKLIDAFFVENKIKTHKPIESKLLKCLDVNDREEIYHLTVYFADTNWSTDDPKSECDLHFIAYPNPCTGKVQLGMAPDCDCEAAFEIKALNQSVWFGNVTWEIFFL